MNNKNIARLVATASLTAGFAIAATVPAMASHGGGGVERSGSCSASSNWKVKAKHDNGQLEVEGEVDSNVTGQTWNWRFLDNGTVAAKGTSVTGGASGSFSAQRRIADLAGADKIVFKAKNPATGETCKGTVTIK